MYSKISLEEIRRREDLGLRKRVENFWKDKGFPIPEFFQKMEPAGILGRHVATMRNEDVAFSRLCQQFDLPPLWLEYLGDIFLSISKPKTSLVYPTNKDGERIKLANPNHWEKKSISVVVLDSGERLVDFHHKLWEKIQSDKKKRYDISSWFQSFGTAKDYYFAVLSLFVAHGVLFKDFHGNGKLSSKSSGEFTKKIVEPSFSKVIDVFGSPPMIYKFKFEEGFDKYPLL